MIFQKTSYRGDKPQAREDHKKKKKLFIPQLSCLQTEGRIKVTLKRHDQIFFPLCTLEIRFELIRGKKCLL